MKKFNKLVSKILIENGFNLSTQSNNETYYFAKETTFGLLKITIHNEKSKIYSIFMRFDTFFNKEIFRERFSLIGFNEYSLKWNLHDTDENSIINNLNSRLKNS